MSGAVSPADALYRVFRPLDLPAATKNMFPHVKGKAQKLVCVLSRYRPRGLYLCAGNLRRSGSFSGAVRAGKPPRFYLIFQIHFRHTAIAVFSSAWFAFSARFSMCNYIMFSRSLQDPKPKFFILFPRRIFL